MARRKKKQLDILDRLVQSFSLRGILLHQATLFIAASCLVIGGVIFLWKNNQSTIVDIDAYQLTANKIVMPEPPPWVDLDPRELILGTEDSPSILNPMLIADTAEKVEGMLFVDQVHSISKSKSGVEIDLAYRRPVAVVTIDSNTMPKVIEKGVEIKLAVDRNGVVMPKQLSQTPHLPIISMLYPVKRQTQLNTWADWPDARVRAAAKISQYFPERRLGVKFVVTAQKPDQLEQEHPFELWSSQCAKGTRIIWGIEPDSQTGDEATVQQKLAAIDDLISRLGSLDRKTGRVFDVRTGQAVEVPRDKVAAMPEMNF